MSIHPIFHRFPIHLPDLSRGFSDPLVTHQPWQWNIRINQAPPGPVACHPATQSLSHTQRDQGSCEATWLRQSVELGRVNRCLMGKRSE